MYIIVEEMGECLRLISKALTLAVRIAMDIAIFLCIFFGHSLEDNSGNQVGRSIWLPELFVQFWHSMHKNVPCKAKEFK
jgi:hypothetical protein